MSAKQSRNLLLIAFAISLLLHLIFAFNFHRRGSESPTDIEVVQIEHRAIVIRDAETPPPPRASETHARRPTSSPSAEAHRIGQQARRGQNGGGEAARQGRGGRRPRRPRPQPSLQTPAAATTPKPHSRRLRPRRLSQ